MGTTILGNPHIASPSVIADQPWPPSNCLGVGFPIVRQVLLLQLANCILLYWMCCKLPKKGKLAVQYFPVTLPISFEYQYTKICVYIYIYWIGKSGEDPMCTTGPLPDTHDSSWITSPHMSMILSVSNKNDIRPNFLMTTCFWTIINVTKWYLPIEAWNKRKEDLLTPSLLEKETTNNETIVRFNHLQMTVHCSFWHQYVEKECSSQ